MNDGLPAQPACPWTDVDAHGSGLELEQFLSFQVVRLAHTLHRVSSRSYLDAHELTTPDWRVLAFVKRYGPVRFSELVARTSLDKAQVSRTVRSLRERGLISTEGDAGHAQRLVLDITRAGQRLHARVLPEAASTQARLLRKLEPAERQALWSALHKLQLHATGPVPPEDGTAAGTRPSRKKP
ncbi:MAG: MarR family transcriptional regulator [Ramlibacter sp.]|nr:MarR family transcriptional regulator [Ramlibacter sp.]